MMIRISAQTNLTHSLSGKKNLLGICTIAAAVLCKLEFCLALWRILSLQLGRMIASLYRP